MRFWLGHRLPLGFFGGVSFNPAKLASSRRVISADPVDIEGTFLYVATGGYGRIRIGSSKNPLANIRKASLLYVGVTQSDGIEILGYAHGYLGRYKDENGWFKCPPEVAIAAISAGAASYKQSILSIEPDTIPKILHVAALEQQAQQSPDKIPRSMWAFFKIMFLLWVAAEVFIIADTIRHPTAPLVRSDHQALSDR